MMPPGVPDLPVVLVSHRGPVSFRRDQTGARTASRGAGGLVTALTGLASSLPDAVWVCAATTNEGGQLVRRAWGPATAGTAALAVGLDRLLAQAKRTCRRGSSSR